MGDESGAMADYAKAAEIEPSKADNWFNIAFHQAFYDGHFEESLPYYNQAIKLDPKVWGQYWQRGLVYMGLNRMPEALADFRNAFTTGKAGDSTGDTAQECTWMMRARLGEQTAASRELAAYLKTLPPAKSDDAQRRLSLRFFAGELTEAQFFREAEALAPKEGDRIYSFFMAGMKRLAEGDRTGAKLYFEKCVNLSESKQGWFYWNSFYELKRLRS